MKRIVILMILIMTEAFAVSPVYIDADYIASDMNGEEVPVHLYVSNNGISLSILNGVESMKTVPNENTAVDALTGVWTLQGNNVALVNISYLVFNDSVYVKNTTSIQGDDLVICVEDPSMFIDPNYFEIKIINKEGDVLLDVTHLGYAQ